MDCPLEGSVAWHHEANRSSLSLPGAEQEIAGDKAPRAVVIDQEPPLLELDAREVRSMDGPDNLLLLDVLADHRHREGRKVTFRDTLLIGNLHTALQLDLWGMAAEGFDVQALLWAQLETVEDRVVAPRLYHLAQGRPWGRSLLVLLRQGHVRQLQQWRGVKVQRLHYALLEAYQADSHVEEARTVSLAMHGDGGHGAAQARDVAKQDSKLRL
mmetsp:Transcript_18296/g.38972  ORF Transcript_18296/g.38972 Transcript_18296/m.38972 type:complete len:213 (-) Transcript_18296:264-902(-)